MNAKPIHIIGLGVIIISQVLLACTNAPPQPTTIISVTPMKQFTATNLGPTLTHVRPSATPDELISFGEKSTPDEPGVTLTSTATLVKPTWTATLVPTPVATLVAHTWQPNAVLIYMDEQGGDGGPAFPYPPNFILYADGRAFVQTWFQVNDEYRLQILTKQFDNSELCQLINTIDQIGFFDYDAASYDIDMNNPPVDGTSTTLLQVNAWRANSVELYGLGSILRHEEEFQNCERCQHLPTILPAIRNTYNLIQSYPHDDWKVFEPERLGLWIFERQKTTRNTIAWPLDQPSLEDLYSESSSDFYLPPSVVLRGEAARKVYLTFDNSIDLDGLLFTDGTYRYPIIARPLLPYEAPPLADEEYSEIPAPIFPTPSFSLTCQPSNGILDIPK